MFTILDIQKLRREVLTSNKHHQQFHERLGINREGHFFEKPPSRKSIFKVIYLGLLGSGWELKSKGLQ